MRALQAQLAGKLSIDGPMVFTVDEDTPVTLTQQQVRTRRQAWWRRAAVLHALPCPGSMHTRGACQALLEGSPPVQNAHWLAVSTIGTMPCPTRVGTCAAVWCGDWAQVAAMPHREYGRLWCSYVSAMAACLLDLRTRGSQDAASRLVSHERSSPGAFVRGASLSVASPRHCWRWQVLSACATTQAACGSRGMRQAEQAALSMGLAGTDAQRPCSGAAGTVVPRARGTPPWWIRALVIPTR